MSAKTSLSTNSESKVTKHSTSQSDARAADFPESPAKTQSAPIWQFRSCTMQPRITTENSKAKQSSSAAETLLWTALAPPFVSAVKKWVCIASNREKRCLQAKTKSRKLLKTASQSTTAGVPRKSLKTKTAPSRQSCSRSA